MKPGAGLPEVSGAAGERFFPTMCAYAYVPTVCSSSSKLRELDCAESRQRWPGKARVQREASGLSSQRLPYVSRVGDRKNTRFFNTAHAIVLKRGTFSRQVSHTWSFVGDMPFTISARLTRVLSSATSRERMAVPLSASSVARSFTFCWASFRPVAYGQTLQSVSIRG